MQKSTQSVIRPPMNIRRANLKDISRLLELYSMAYNGTYPDSTFTDVNNLIKLINSADRFLFVYESDGEIVASTLFLYEESHLLAKAGGAVVLPDFRGQNITRQILEFGINYINENTKGFELLYITTRTVNRAAQVLTKKMGFKELGVFPNVHKTQDYETHALSVLLYESALKKRYTTFEHHPNSYPLYSIAEKTCELPKMDMAKEWIKKEYQGEVPSLEIVEAKEFLNHRFKNLKTRREIDLGFLPFHKPNLLITSPDQRIEVFLYENEIDKHCVFAGLKMDREVSLTNLFIKVSNMLRDRGVRYIEVISRANRLNFIDKLCQAKFLPSAYVPAFQLEGEKRFDYIVFSRSFEVIDFKNIELTGANQEYLSEYVKLWEECHLGKNILKK